MKLPSERSWLEALERTLAVAAEPSVAWVSLAFVAGGQVEFAENELSAARRRAMLVLAVGGDPHRDLTLDAPAVTTLAADLDDATRRDALARGLSALRLQAPGLTLVGRELDRLSGDPDLAWRCFACALLAEELAGDE